MAIKYRINRVVLEQIHLSLENLGFGYFSRECNLLSICVGKTKGFDLTGLLGFYEYLGVARKAKLGHFRQFLAESYPPI